MNGTELFGRRGIVTVDTIQIETLEFAFQIEKSLKPEPNTCDLVIWNLNEEHRSQLEELRPKEKVATKGIPCKIEAGYGDDLAQLWLGDLRTIESVLEGPTWETKLTSGDGEKAWKNARLHIGYGPKVGIDTALRAIARALGVGEGNLSKVVSKLKQAGSAIFPSGTSFSGAARNDLITLARSADLEVSIQDGALQFIDRGQALAGTAVNLSEATGLLGSPSVDNEGYLTAKMLMIPDIRVGGLVNVEADRVKGAYRIEKATWSGDMSGNDWEIEIVGKRY